MFSRVVGYHVVTWWHTSFVATGGEMMLADRLRVVGGGLLWDVHVTKHGHVYGIITSRRADDTQEENR